MTFLKQCFFLLSLGVVCIVWNSFLFLMKKHYQHIFLKSLVLHEFLGDRFVLIYHHTVLGRCFKTLVRTDHHSLTLDDFSVPRVANVLCRPPFHFNTSGPSLPNLIVSALRCFAGCRHVNCYWTTKMYYAIMRNGLCATPSHITIWQ